MAANVIMIAHSDWWFDGHRGFGLNSTTTRRWYTRGKKLKAYL